MGRDYYKLLELPRNANQEEIAKAFRRLGLKHHPMRSATDMATNSYRFSEICEAFEILSNPTTKGIFDQYGEDILKEGFPDGKGNLKGGYKFAGNATEIFRQRGSKSKTRWCGHGAIRRDPLCSSLDHDRHALFFAGQRVR